MVHVSAPGKLMIVGEWAVLDLGNPCVVAAVGKRVHCEIEEAENLSIELKDFGISSTGKFEEGKIVLENEDEKFGFAKAAVEVVTKYVGSFKPFRMTTWGEETVIEGQKIGFGSSAAAVVAIVSGLLKFYGYEPEKELVYKLSTIAHYFAQGKVGSAFDVAASTYGGLIVYKRFDPNWLSDQMGKDIKEVVEKEWSGFYVEPLNIPDDFILVVGWTGTSASTSAMVKQMANFDQEERKIIYAKISSLVNEFIDALKKGDKQKVLELIKRNEEILRELTEKSGIPIETEKLKILSDLANEAGGAGKLSGAGGGDCGIGVCFDTNTAERIKEEWEKNGIKVVDVSIDKHGFKFF